MKKSNSGVDTLAKYLVSGTCVVTAGGLLSGCVVGEWTLVEGGSKRRRPTDTGAHLQHTQPAFQAAGPSQKGPNVAKSGQMWPKEAKVAENGQKLSKGVPWG